MPRLFASIAQFESELIREHAGTGWIAALKRGVRFRRPASLSSDQAAQAKWPRVESNFAKEVAKTFGDNRSIIDRMIGSEM
jgi:DNA invertase Pin-like site-specific DNA recombinase